VQLALHLTARLLKPNNLTHTGIGGSGHPNQARRQLLEEPQHLLTPQLSPDDNIAGGINRMNLKYRLRKVDANGRNLFHSLAFPASQSEMASGSVGIFPSATFRPFSSTTQMAVCSIETSRAAYFVMAVLLPALRH
jgi:hypothetical protein